MLGQRAALGDNQFMKIENVVEVFVTRDEDNEDQLLWAKQTKTTIKRWLIMVGLSKFSGGGWQEVYMWVVKWGVG